MTDYAGYVSHAKALHAMLNTRLLLDSQTNFVCFRDSVAGKNLAGWLCEGILRMNESIVDDTMSV